MTHQKNTNAQPQYRRAKEICEQFRIAPSTLWLWAKTRSGFPQPLKAGPKVTLFDANAIARYLEKGQ